MKPAEYYRRDRNRHPPALAPGYKTSVARSPRLSLISLEQTASELTGPVFGQSDIAEHDNDLLRNYARTGDPIGERIIVHGRVLDENARPVAGTLQGHETIHFWQSLDLLQRQLFGFVDHSDNLQFKPFGFYFGYAVMLNAENLILRRNPFVKCFPIQPIGSGPGHV